MTSWSVSFATSAMSVSASESSTMTRRAERQFWPLDAKADWTMSATALAMSATSQTMIALLPPILSESILSGLPAVARAMARPVGVEPVNSTPLTRSSATSASPTSRPPITQRSSASGTPAPCIRSTSDWPVAGVISEGLNSTPLPAIKAATIWSLAILAGKAAGLITAMSPSGRWRRPCLAPSAPSRRRDPARSETAPTARSIDMVRPWTSVLASHSGRPVSRAIRSANFSSWARTLLAKRRIVSTRLTSGSDAPRLDGAFGGPNFLRNIARLAFPKQGAGGWLIGSEH